MISMKNFLLGLFLITLLSCGSGNKGTGPQSPDTVQQPQPIPSAAASNVPAVNSIAVWREKQKITLEFPASLHSVNLRFSEDSDCDLSTPNPCSTEAVVNAASFEHQVTQDASVVYYRFSANSQIKTYVLRLGGYRGFDHPTEISTAVFKGRVWQNDGYGLETSADGIVWKRVVTEGFPQRAAGKLIQFNKKLWLIGGYDNSIYIPFGPDYNWPTNAVYSSDDGIKWVLENAQAEFPAYPEYKPVEFNNQLWLFGGNPDQNRNIPPSDFKSAWVSSDGIQWAQAPGNLPFNALNVTNAVVWQNQMWVLVGFDKSVGTWAIPQRAELWSSPDGVNWNKQALPDPVLEGAELIVLGGGLQLISPYQISGRLLAWHFVSQSWQSHPLPDFIGSTYRFRIIPLADSVAISLQYGFDIARSSDGITWRVDSSIPASTRTVTRYQNRFVMYSGKVLDKPEKPSLLQSTDGVNWSELTVDLPIEPRSGASLMSQGDRLWLFGGEDTNHKSVPGLWRSDDGKSWLREDVEFDVSDVIPSNCRSSWGVATNTAEQSNCIFDSSLLFESSYSSVVLGDKPLFFKSNAIAFKTYDETGTVPFSTPYSTNGTSDISDGFRLLLIDGSAANKRQEVVLNKLSSVLKPVNNKGKLASLDYPYYDGTPPECYFSSNGTDWQHQKTDFPKEFKHSGYLFVNQGRFWVFASMNWGVLTSFGDGYEDSYFSTALWSSEDCVHWNLEVKRSLLENGFWGTHVYTNGYLYYFNGDVLRSRDGRLWQRGYHLFERFE